MSENTFENNDGNEINNPSDATAQVKGDEAAGNTSDQPTETVTEREQHVEETVTETPAADPNAGTHEGSGANDS